MYINKRYRLPWLNMAAAYFSAAEIIFKKIQVSPKSDYKKWQYQVAIIPLLFLLRQTLELCIKSIFISNGVPVIITHDFKILIKEAEKFINISDQKNKELWGEVKDLANDFSKTKYGKEPLFSSHDLNSTALRYLQVSDFDNYKQLKDINYKSLFKRVQRVKAICELITFKPE